MKNYRLKKQYIDPNGRIVKPQILEKGSLRSYFTSEDNFIFGEYFVESNKEFFEEIKIQNKEQEGIFSNESCWMFEYAIDSEKKRKIRIKKRSDKDWQEWVGIFETINRFVASNFLYLQGGELSEVLHLADGRIVECKVTEPKLRDLLNPNELGKVLVGGEQILWFPRIKQENIKFCMCED